MQIVMTQVCLEGSMCLLLAKLCYCGSLKFLRVADGAVMASSCN